MKLSRLESTTQHHSQDAIERARHVAGESVRRVEALEGVEGDRQRSLQQELADFDPKAVGAFDGGDLIMATAHDVATQLSTLGSAAHSLLKTPDMRLIHTSVDAKA